MGWNCTFAFIIALKACTLLSFCPWKTVAKTVIVGGSAGWTNFDDSLLAAPDYASWASYQTLQTGDSLVFKYKPIYHDVYMLPNKKAFDYCNFTDATVLDEGKSGTYTWIPSKKGVYYFACNRSVEGAITHCEAGQKVSITVSAKSDSQSPMVSPFLAPGISPSLAPGISPSGVSPSYTPTSLPLFPPSSTSRSPAISPTAPEWSPASNFVPSSSPTVAFPPSAAIPSAAPPLSPLSPNPILAPITGAVPISSSLPPSVSIPSSSVPSSSNSPFISSTPSDPLSQVGANTGSGVPLAGLNEEKSAAILSGLQHACRIGILFSITTSFAFLLLLV